MVRVEVTGSSSNGTKNTYFIARWQFQAWDYKTPCVPAVQGGEQLDSSTIKIGIMLELGMEKHANIKAIDNFMLLTDSFLGYLTMLFQMQSS
jgi:hypothetical protein